MEGNQIVPVTLTAFNVCWSGDWVHACCQVARKDRGHLVSCLEVSGKQSPRFVSNWGTNLFTPRFLHYTAVSFICYQHPQHEYHARFSGQTSPNLRKKSIYMPRIVIQSISPSVFFIGIASVPDPKGACDFKKRKGCGVWLGAEGVTVVTQAYVESSHGGEAPGRRKWEQAHPTKVKQTVSSLFCETWVASFLKISSRPCFWVMYEALTLVGIRDHLRYGFGKFPPCFPLCVNPLTLSLAPWANFPLHILPAVMLPPPQVLLNFK